MNNHINNIKEVITYCNKAKKSCKNYKTLNTVLGSVDSSIIIGATSTSITSSIKRVGLFTLPRSTGNACTLTLGNKVLHELILSKYNEYNKQCEKDQQTIKSFDKLYRKFLQNNTFDKNEYESLCNLSTKHIVEIKNESFL